MAEKTKNTKEEYRQARDRFDSLKIEEKAIFLVESAFSMLAQGIEALGSMFSEQINKVYEEAETKAADSEKEKQTPPKKTAAKKAAPKKATTKRRTTKRSSTAKKGTTNKGTPKKEA